MYQAILMTETEDSLKAQPMETQQPMVTTEQDGLQIFQLNQAIHSYKVIAISIILTETFLKNKVLSEQCQSRYHISMMMQED